MTRRVLVAALLIALVLVALYWLSQPWWILLGNAFLLLAAREYSALTAPQPALAKTLLLPPLLLLPWMWAYYPGQLVGFFLLAWLYMAVGSLLGGELRNVRVMATSCFSGLIYLGIPIALASGFHPGAGAEPAVLTLLLLMVWASDAAAFIVGRSFGSRRITPTLSPNKTLEGYVGALLAPAGVGALLASGLIGANAEPWRVAAAGVLVGAAATLGDLFESALKRGAGVKDSSSLLPGHGGILDRIDSFLFALPVYWLIVPWIAG